MKFHAIGDSSPLNTLLKQEGLQLAEASFRDLEETNVDSRYRARKVDRLIWFDLIWFRIDLDLDLDLD